MFGGPSVREDLLGAAAQIGMRIMFDRWQDAVTILHRDLIITLAARLRLPAVYPYRFFATSGGFISYGVDVPDLYREAASYIDRILKGAKPGDLLARRVCHRSNDRLYA